MLRPLPCIALAALLAGLTLGCEKDSSSSSSPSDAGSGSTAKADRSAEPTITISPAGPTVSAGEELELTGRLSHVPAGQNRWLASVGWKTSDGQSKAQALKDQDGRFVNTVGLTWDEPGTYTVTLTYYASNKPFGSASVEVTVE